MRIIKLIFALCLLLTFSVVKVEAYTDAKTGRAQLNMNKLLSSTLKKHDHRWCRREGWNTVCYDNNLYEDCTLFCNNNNNYTYNFDYEIKKNHSEVWKPLVKNETFKCDTVRSKFGVIGDWGATLEKKCADIWRNIKVYSACWSHSPPTDIIECSGKEDCLYKARGYTLTPEYSGKGVQQVPANFVSGVEKSLVSDNTATTCADGSCSITKEGKYNLSMKAPETMYYGQCKGYGMTLEPDGTKIPAVSSALALDVVNRAPITTVTLSKKEFKPEEEIDVYCDAFDPDDCVDKISKVKMYCIDAAGNTDKCLIYDPNTGILNNSLTKEIPVAEQTNPYRLSAKFKVKQNGNYAVVCNATDNNGTTSTYPDGSGNGSGSGVGGGGTGGDTPRCTPNDNRCDANCTPEDVDCAKCGADGVCITGCATPDPDCPAGGVIDASMRFCALVANKGTDAPICESGSEIKYSVEALYNINPTKYKWKCGEESSEDWKETTEGKYSCNYSKPGTFSASLRVVDKGGKEINCKLQDKVKLTTEKSCRIEVRKSGSTEDFSDSVVVRTGESVEARIKQECLGKSPVTWAVSGGTLGETKNGLTEIKFNSAGEKSIGAKMTKTVQYTEDGKQKSKQEVTDCTGAIIDVKDSSSWSPS